MAPCWPPLPEKLECCEEWEAATPAQRARAERAAARILNRLTGGQFWSCAQTVRPCGPRCDRPSTYRGPVVGVAGRGMFNPHMIGAGVWVNSLCPDGCDTCSRCCCDVCEVTLFGPVLEIEEVLLDGQVVDPDTYFVLDASRLVRKRGYPCWPSCQDLDAGPDEPGAFAVIYRWGLPLDVDGQAAYEAYACELLKACLDDCECRLPKRVTNIVREGVTASFVDDLEFLDRGRTGIPEVDQWIASVNPYRATEPSVIMSPDYRPPAAHTSPPYAGMP